MTRTTIADHAPAVILGSTEPALAAARDLATRGIPVIAVHFGLDKAIAAYSRCLTLKHAPRLDDEAAVVAWLVSLAKEFARPPVLLPTLDQTVLLLHRHRTTLAKHYRFYVWESEVLAELGSKAGLGVVVERFGLPAPRTLAPANRTELMDGIVQLRFPCIVKPEFTNSWWTEAARALGLDRKAIEVQSVDELLDVYDRSQQVGSQVAIQEKIVGPDANHMSYFVFVGPNGELTGEMIAQKHRVYPPHFGVACYAEALTTPDAIAVGRDVITRLGYRGFASVQLKRDARDGRLYLIEVNLRLPLSVELAIRAGRSFPYYYYQTALGASYEDPPLRVGQKWMSFRRDFQSLRTYAREGTWSWPRWARDVLALPAFAIFRWHDPLPALAAFLAWLRQQATREQTRPKLNRTRRATTPRLGDGQA